MRSAILARSCCKRLKTCKPGAGRVRQLLQPQPDGSIMRRIKRADGVIEKEEHLTGARWELMFARFI